LGHVVDASALAKAFLDEEGAAAFRAFLWEAVDEGRTLRAPRLLAYELGNIVAFQYPEAEPERRAAILEDGLTLVRTEPIEEPGALFPLVDEAGSFHDAAYLWLARDEDGLLVTYDEGLADAAAKHGVDTLQPGAG
jgi:predicted nucleic acid-binding protein